jgi:predicted nucleic acid-binding protein
MKMPIVDTQFLFALNPKDKHHTGVSNILEKVKAGEIRNLVVTDTAIFEYCLILRSKGFDLV